MAEQPYTVVVGISATSKSPAALKWAKAQADQNHGRVIAVRAWRVHSPSATPSGPPSGLLEEQEAHGDEAQAELERDVADTLGPDHGVDVRAVRGSSFEALIDNAADADLLVVDAPRQLIAGPMFAHRLVYAATCPVVVMPPDLSGAPPPSVWQKFGSALADRLIQAAGTAGRPGYRPPLIK